MKQMPRSRLRYVATTVNTCLPLSLLLYVSWHDLICKIGLIFWRMELLFVLYIAPLLPFTVEYPLNILKRSGWPCPPSSRSVVWKLGEGSSSSRGWYLTIDSLFHFSLKRTSTRLFPTPLQCNNWSKSHQWTPHCQVKWSILHYLYLTKP